MYETLYPGGSDDQALVIYMAEPGTSSETSLRLLGTMVEPRAAQGRNAERADVQLGRALEDT